MNIFQWGDFKLHSGQCCNFKIDCDFLSDLDIVTLAKIITTRVYFCEVFGIPRGGIRLAKALEPYCRPSGCLLIVDDVMTTGASMEEARRSFGRFDTQGVVIFSRGACPAWVWPIFQMVI